VIELAPLVLDILDELLPIAELLGQKCFQPTLILRLKLGETTGEGPFVRGMTQLEGFRVVVTKDLLHSAVVEVLMEVEKFVQLSTEGGL
jgi:hypothetical protein